MTDQTVETINFDQERQNLITAVATAYDLQKLRIMTGNRLCANFRHKLGLQASESEDELEEQTKKVLDRVRADFDLMTEGVVHITKPDGSLDVPRSNRFKPVGCITSLGEYMLVQQYLSLEAQEHDHFYKSLPSLLLNFRIFTHYLAHVKGIGPAMAAIIIRYLDIHKAPYPSNFWAYAGLDVVNTEKNGEMTGRGRGRYKEHLVPRQYTDRSGEVTETMGITFNPFFKTKLMGVMGGSFLKCKSPYAQVYYDYKNRLENHPKHMNKTKSHKHAMALRYMVKIFLVDLHANWCELEGLPPSRTYQEIKLGHVHGGDEARPLLTHLMWPEDKRKPA